MQLLKALLAELVEAGAHGYWLLQNVEADAALKQVFECLDRDYVRFLNFPIAVVAFIVNDYPWFFYGLIEAEPWNCRHDKFVGRKPPEPHECLFFLLKNLFWL